VIGCSDVDPLLGYLEIQRYKNGFHSYFTTAEAMLANARIKQTRLKDDYLKTKIENHHHNNI
jgi:hypothetical protein